MPKIDKTSIHPVLGPLWRFAGDSRLLVVSYQYQDGPARQVLVKPEYQNPIGDIRYRRALYVLQAAIDLGQLRPGDHIVEASAGATGLAYAAIGRALGHRVTIFTPAGNPTLIEALRRYGAAVETGRDPADCRQRVALLQHQDGFFWPARLSRTHAIEASERTTGREIGHQLLLNRLHPDALVAATVTGATLLGAGDYLRKLYPSLQVHPVEADIPDLQPDHGDHYPETSALKRPVRVAQPAIGLVQAQLHALGIAAGPVSAANLLGAIELQQSLPPRSLVITLWPDREQPALRTLVPARTSSLRLIACRQLGHPDLVNS